MTKLLFICHGNICRSPMAEMIFKNFIKERELEDEFFVDSVATSNEEIGNTIYPKARKVLEENDIDIDYHVARRIKKEDYDNFDYLICMDDANVRNLLSVIENDNQKKVYKLLNFTGNDKDIEDPWYTNRFDKVYKEIELGCKCLLEFILNNDNV